MRYKFTPAVWYPDIEIHMFCLRNPTREGAKHILHDQFVIAVGTIVDGAPFTEEYVIDETDCTLIDPMEVASDMKNKMLKDHYDSWANKHLYTGKFES